MDDLRDIQIEHDLLDSALKKLQTVKAELSKREIERDQLTARADVCTSILAFISQVLISDAFNSVQPDNYNSHKKSSPGLNKSQKTERTKHKRPLRG